MINEMKLAPRVKFYQNETVYGPVPSRRLGYSLGINVNLEKRKTCNFNCVYCQLGRTITKVTSPKDVTIWRNEEKISTEVERKLQMLSREKRRLDSITFSGYGETALYPHLERLVHMVRETRDKYYPTVPIRILTNSSLIIMRKVYNAFKHLDYVVAKLDVGTPKAFQAINRPVDGVSQFNDFVDMLAKFQRKENKIVIQTLIFNSNREDKPRNIDKLELESLIEKLCFINPVEIQIYTLARLPAEPFVIPVRFEILQKIAATINQRIGRPCAKAYPNSEEQIKYTLKMEREKRQKRQCRNS